MLTEIINLNSIIKSIDIIGLWGIKDISFSLSSDVNILIGDNGTGKTTVLKLIEAILNLNLSIIDDIQFTEIYIHLYNKSNDSIKIECIFNEINKIYKYTFNNNDSYNVTATEERRLTYRKRIYTNTQYDQLHEKLHNLINISWLPINRIDFENNKQPEDIGNNIDIKLNLLMNQLISFRLQLETKVNEATKNFTNKIIKLLLYNKEYDSVPSPDKVRKRKIQKEKLIQDLSNTFNNIGNNIISDDEIRLHVEQIMNIIEKSTRSAAIFRADELLSFSLLNRTLEILTLSNNYQEERTAILEPITIYIETLRYYFKNKDIKLDQNYGLMPFLSGKDGGKYLPIYSLSSGEKQLLILLTEILIQQQKPFVFIADEPELSLHIEWQHNLISSIRKLNPNVQVIFATHAPEIAANYPDNIINLNNVTSYTK